MRKIAPYIKIILALSCILLVCNYTAFAKKKVSKICIDAGHGGKDPGCHGQYSYEKDITLAISKRLGQMIQQNMRDVKTVYTRDYDWYPELKERTEIANNAKADLFISIHVNSTPKRVTTAHGVLMLICGPTRMDEKAENIGENVNNINEEQDLLNPNDPTTQILIAQYSQAFLTQSIVLGTAINDQFIYQNRPSEGIRQQSLQVLASSAMPGVLVEIGYLNNPEDEVYLNSEQGQIEVATAIFNGIKKYKNELEGKATTTQQQQPLPKEVQETPLPQNEIIENN